MKHSAKVSNILAKILHNIHGWPHVRRIKTPSNKYDVTVIIGADMLQIHLKEHTKIGEANDPIAVLNNIRLGANV